MFYVNFQIIKQKHLMMESIMSTPPCLDNEVEISYMNTIQVRQALHIPDSLKQEWTVCRYGTVKPVLSGHSKKDKTKVLKTNGS